MWTFWWVQNTLEANVHTATKKKPKPKNSPHKKIKPKNPKQTPQKTEKPHKHPNSKYPQNRKILSIKAGKKPKKNKKEKTLLQQKISPNKQIRNAITKNWDYKISRLASISAPHTIPTSTCQYFGLFLSFQLKNQQLIYSMKLQRPKNEDAKTEVQLRNPIL